MPTPADEPLRKVTLNLFQKDVEELERVYGFGWTEQVRLQVRKFLDTRREYRKAIELLNKEPFNG